MRKASPDHRPHDRPGHDTRYRPEPDPQHRGHDLRGALRAGTRAAHERVDVVYARYDLARRSDYVRFLTAHREALLGLPLAPAPCGLPPLDLDAPLRADLRELGARVADAPRPPAAGESFRLGCYYTVAGAQAGSRILLRRWRASADPSMRNAGRYLQAAAAGTGWAAFRALRAPSLDVREVLAGAEAAFDRFHAAGVRHSLDPASREARPPAAAALPDEPAPARPHSP